MFGAARTCPSSPVCVLSLDVVLCPCCVHRVIRHVYPCRVHPAVSCRRCRCPPGVTCCPAVWCHAMTYLVPTRHADAMYRYDARVRSYPIPSCYVITLSATFSTCRFPVLFLHVSLLPRGAVCWTSAKCGEWQMALKLFDSLFRAGLSPDVRTYCSAILACFKGQQVSLA